MIYCTVDDAMTASLQIKSWNFGNDFQGGYRWPLRYTIFYVTRCVVIVAHKWLLRICPRFRHQNVVKLIDAD